MLNSNLLYVGLTRMKKKCFHLGTLTSVNQAVVKKANLTRHTFMQQLLLSEPTESFTESSEENEDDMPWYSDEELRNNNIYDIV